MSLRVILSEIRTQFIPDLLHEILDYLDIEIAELFALYRRPKHVLLYDIFKSGFNLQQMVNKWKTTFNRLSWKRNRYINFHLPDFDCQCLESIITLPKSPHQWAKCIREQNNVYYPTIATIIHYTDFVGIPMALYALFLGIQRFLSRKFPCLRSVKVEIILRIVIGVIAIISVFRIIFFSIQFYDENKFVLRIERMITLDVNHHNKLLLKYQKYAEKYKQNEYEDHFTHP